MENFSKFIRTLAQQLSSFWKSLTVAKRVVTLMSISLVFVGLISLLFYKNKTDYEYLFVNLSSEDSQSIADFLKKSGEVKFIIDNKGIKVPANQASEYRLKLSQEGLPTHGQVGLEKFDNSDFTRTEFERKINKNRAIQGELARTIMSIDGVLSARVHIVFPSERVFQKDQKESTAAVYVKTVRGKELSSRQIGGIVHLISKSVEGLKAENISIIDAEGKLLTDDTAKDPSSKQNKEMLEYSKNVEKQLEEKIVGIVGRIVGQDKVEAKVDASLDFTKEEQTISDVDPDRVVALSSSTTSQSVDGSRLNPTGIPGSKSNVPGESEQLNLATSKSQSSRSSELVNYEVSKVISHKVLPTAKITKLSAAVIVDGKQTYSATGTTTFEPRSEEEMKKIESLVKTAIGYVEGRDEISVHNVMFQIDPMDVATVKQEVKNQRDYIYGLAVSGVIALSVILFFAFIVRPYMRWLAYDPERKAKEKKVEEFSYNFDTKGGNISNVYTYVEKEKTNKGTEMQEEIMQIAKTDPERTVEAMRVFLNTEV